MLVSRRFVADASRVLAPDLNGACVDLSESDRQPANSGGFRRIDYINGCTLWGLLLKFQTFHALTKAVAPSQPVVVTEDSCV